MAESSPAPRLSVRQGPGEPVRFGPAQRPASLAVVLLLGVFFLAVGLWGIANGGYGSKSGLPMNVVHGPLVTIIALSVIVVALAMMKGDNPNLVLTAEGPVYTTVLGDRLRWRWSDIESIAVWREDHGLSGKVRMASGVIVIARSGRRTRLRELDRPGEDIEQVLRDGIEKARINTSRASVPAPIRPYSD